MDDNENENANDELVLVWLTQAGNTGNCFGATSPPNKRISTSDPQIVYAVS
jgi:hypothetical protein